MSKFSEQNRNQPFADYNEYMTYLFATVNSTLDEYLANMKITFASEQGGYKNVLYPDLEIAHDVAKNHVSSFWGDIDDTEEIENAEEDGLLDDVEEDESLKELLDIFSAFSASEETFEEDTKKPANTGADLKGDLKTPLGKLKYINERAEISHKMGMRFPFYEICRKQRFEPFTVFCFVSAILSSTQTDYASIFQVINENGNLVSPTIESAARLYFGNKFSITGAYGQMSTCLEQLTPIFPLKVVTSMPFSTSVSPDKRIIDFLFGADPYKTDEAYSRYFSSLDCESKLDPILANENVLDAMKIAYKEGNRIFSYTGDEGSGRKFFVKYFCQENNLRAITMNCKKLFATDFSFVDQALWSLSRECLLTGSCAVLEELTFREETKEQFQTYMDMAFTKLTDKDVTVFTTAKEKIDFKDITKKSVIYLDIPFPDIDGRIKCWEYFSQGYKLDEECDLIEMSNKFIFTPGKIADALKYAKSLAVMDKCEAIPRNTLFKGCNAQMSSELSQKATRVEAKFGFEDIVMNEDQRETIMHAIDQMNFKKQVYEQWNYMKKYPYGRGLTVLLFGAPGTGKSMMAQVLAHELNLELYRVDISKVVDKYVGETEKSLSMIFREAKKCNVVLFFDECDTIFAKRSDDGGSNQASANNKTALLLQEMEAYDGVCVLATNYKHNIDPAFFRRMKYIVEFQFPNPDTREMLWTTTVPKTTPLAEDVDFRFIAEKFEFAGGNIKNCILNAAFLAAGDKNNEDGLVHMRHYLQAIRYEFVKTGKVFTRADFEPYAEEVFGEMINRN